MASSRLSMALGNLGDPGPLDGLCAFWTHVVFKQSQIKKSHCHYLFLSPFISGLSVSLLNLNSELSKCETIYIYPIPLSLYWLVNKDTYKVLL